MRLEIGGVNYTAAPFNGWYMGTEIGARDFGDASRYNVLPVLAEKMGLDTRSERSLWIDRALLEMNVAVNHSFAMAKVSLVDHHMAARHFMRHVERETKAGRSDHRAVELARPTHVGFNHAGLSSGIQEHHPQAQLLLSEGAMGVVDLEMPLDRHIPLIAVRGSCEQAGGTGGLHISYEVLTKALVSKPSRATCRSAEVCIGSQIQERCLDRFFLRPGRDTSPLSPSDWEMTRSCTVVRSLPDRVTRSWSPPPARARVRRHDGSCGSP